MPARFCIHCGQELTASARFCPNCAAPVGDVTQAAQPLGQPPAGSAPVDRRQLQILLACLAIILIGAVAIIAATVHGRNVVSVSTSTPQASPSLMSTPSTTPTAAPALTGVQSTPSPSAPALTGAADPQPGQLPADVAAYLRFLQQIEQRRQALNSDQSGASAMLGMAKQLQASGGEDPEEHNKQVTGSVQKISGGFGEYSQKFQQLAHDFDAGGKPPAACAALANDYGRFLTGYVGAISKLQVDLLNGDISGAMGLQGQQKQITADGISADTDLTQVFARYGVTKSFSIQPEGANPSVLGM